MADENEDRRCAACGGPVGPGGRTLTPLPPRVAPQVKAPPSPAQQIEDATDDITPVQRFDRAIRRRDATATTPKRPSRSGKKDDTAG